MITVKTGELYQHFFEIERKFYYRCIWGNQGNFTMPMAGEMTSLLKTILLKLVDKKILKIKKIENKFNYYKSNYQKMFK